MEEIYRSGRGSFRVRAKWRYDKENNIIEIYEIPYTTTSEAIIDKVAELVKAGKVKEIADMRDETDLGGLKLAIDLKRGQDPDRVMQRLFRLTPLEDAFSCNFNVLIAGMPRVLGVRELLEEWVAWRSESVRRRTHYELTKKQERLHLLQGLGKILLDIDKAIRIIRETAKESDVIPRLMQGFSIDEIQAEYIAELKLRHLNREYILERIKEIADLQKEIADLEAIIADDIKVKELIARQLAAIKKKYGMPRKTDIITDSNDPVIEEDDGVENYAAYVVLTKEGYFKKITRQSLMRADEQKLKDGDEVTNAEDTENVSDLLFFTDRAQVYKAKTADFEPVKASALGDYIAAKLGFDDGERPVMMKALTEYSPDDSFIFLFENGKGVKIPANAYETKTNRKKLTAAYSDASPIAAILFEKAGEPFDILMKNSVDKGILFSSSLIPQKTTRSSSGVILFNMKAGIRITDVLTGEEAAEFPRCRKNKIPATGIAIEKPAEQVPLV
jgi:DNA gyrase subunit A